MVTEHKNSIIQRVQDIEYDALTEVLKICRENRLRVYLRGGSVLGAVKYQDFVPWDDDVDIALPRKDYAVLIKVMPDELKGKYLFVAYQRTTGAHCYFPRIILKKEVCEKESLPQNNERGLTLIDIFPLDGMPDNRVMRRIHVWKAYVYRVLASLWTLDVKDTISMHGKHDKWLSRLNKTGIKHLYKQDSIYRRLDRMYAKYPFVKSRYSGMLTSSKLDREIMLSTDWGRGKRAMFRDTEVRIPTNYDAYLKGLFGQNYAGYEPPENERKKSHLFWEKRR